MTWEETPQRKNEKMGKNPSQKKKLLKIGEPRRKYTLWMVR